MEYRAYFFTNMYISPIQSGIQSGHCINEMHIKQKTETQSEILSEWGNNHKTMILLNGGYSSALEELYDVFTNINLPYAKFNESEEALNSALTCVSIVLPEYIYVLSKDVRNKLIPEVAFDDELYYLDEMQENNDAISWLINNLNNYRLS